MEYIANRDRHFTISTYLHINFYATQYIFYWKLSHRRRKVHTSITCTPPAGVSSNKTTRYPPPFSSTTNETNPSTAMMLTRTQDTDRPSDGWSVKLSQYSIVSAGGFIPARQERSKIACMRTSFEKTIRWFVGFVSAFDKF